jgi:xanthine dehydrogenase accessory factor
VSEILLDIRAELERVGEFALCVLVDAKGSVPRRIGAKMLVFANGTIRGSIGGGHLEKEVIGNAQRVLATKKPALFRHDLLHQHNMCCGGTVEIYIEPVTKKTRLYIFGAGHTGQALARYAPDCGFEVYLIDDRREYLDQCTAAGISKMNLEPSLALQALPFDASVMACIMTYDHAIDREILAACMRKERAYLGMIGSKRKVAITRKKFLAAGLATEAELDRIDMPMGIPIGAEGPAEIAISILSKLIEVKQRRIHG